MASLHASERLLQAGLAQRGMSMVEEGHLGGYVKGGDAATYYPELWKWLASIEALGIRSVLDVGCGEGHSRETFIDNGVRWTGVDGIPQPFHEIYVHDFTKGPLRWRGMFDLCWSCEFVEHVEERFVPNILSAFRLCRIVLMTHAEPGQAGYHHVNCRSADYWTGVMAGSGFQLDRDMTQITRALAGANTSPWNHFKRSGLAFRRFPR